MAIGASAENVIRFDPDEVGMTSIGQFPPDAYSFLGVSSITCTGNIRADEGFCGFKGTVSAGEIADSDSVTYEFAISRY